MYQKFPGSPLQIKENGFSDLSSVKFPGATEHPEKVVSVFPDGMFQEEILVPFVIIKTHP